ncbi:MAG: hypothetical protein ACD_16C00205G0046 [uncultured bacterium]|nr:MAG: hypothetical protein ACD_16C00205G0046 [uncultured bacterium]OFW68781.1 MAG: hypothetical protein A2X70_04710 [Alphaproteobacteria bacterium GWC2_42_16]OFW73288.1 MAG: hypothetical protein A2Z80_03890 [Alphaproteobacteria bacterium GWA2_41_27]OFW81879.1 MAG: hypothetical protein A3E50_07155 [Alphaproteobacteria bacterium RIFCSPHIGHO2_12_FULL_42_100]OFW84870.1 MAG: hypothetical protein A2W06_03355 [Alphaproteobacteria bacterium RBG_16_42_14]OFW90989.1 MAG: hypothetical protein A3C41_041
MKYLHVLILALPILFIGQMVSAQIGGIDPDPRTQQLMTPGGTVLVPQAVPFNAVPPGSDLDPSGDF